MSSECYKTLLAHGPWRVTKWLTNINIFQQNIILISINADFVPLITMCNLHTNISITLQFCKQKEKSNYTTRLTSGTWQTPNHIDSLELIFLQIVTIPTPTKINLLILCLQTTKHFNMNTPKIKQIWLWSLHMKYAIIIVEYCHDHKKYDYIGTSIFFKVDQSDIYHLQATIQVAILFQFRRTWANKGKVTNTTTMNEHMGNISVG